MLKYTFFWQTFGRHLAEVVILVQNFCCELQDQLKHLNLIFSVNKLNAFDVAERYIGY